MTPTMNRNDFSAHGAGLADFLIAVLVHVFCMR